MATEFGVFSVHWRSLVTLLSCFSFATAGGSCCDEQSAVSITMLLWRNHSTNPLQRSRTGRTYNDLQKVLEALASL